MAAQTRGQDLRQPEPVQAGTIIDKRQTRKRIRNRQLPLPTSAIEKSANGPSQAAAAEAGRPKPATTTIPKSVEERKEGAGPSAKIAAETSRANADK